MKKSLTIGVLGTGKFGRGFAARCASVNRQVLLGSRSRCRAEKTAEAIRLLIPKSSVSGLTNSEVASVADIVFVGVPYENQENILREIGSQVIGKIVVVPSVSLIVGRDGFEVQANKSTSAAIEAENTIPESRVVSAFQTISAEDLMDTTKKLIGDVVVCSNDLKARREIMVLTEEFHDLRPLDGGTIENSVALEWITVLLLNMKKINKNSTQPGIRMLGF